MEIFELRWLGSCFSQSEKSETPKTFSRSEKQLSENRLYRRFFFDFLR